ncbi:MAG: hypothetical protein HKN33_07655 [Pyrinomonadaceae bacterium]|nr:hypothetical protein [Pyrinomonadaceae bacterium]
MNLRIPEMFSTGFMFSTSYSQASRRWKMKDSKGLQAFPHFHTTYYYY